MAMCTACARHQESVAPNFMMKFEQSPVSSANLRSLMGARLRARLCEQVVSIGCDVPTAGDGWTMSIMVDKELPHLIQPVAQALFADRSLVSKLTRQRVCHEGFKVAMVPAQFE
jgi:hypothetical protein